MRNGIDGRCGGRHPVPPVQILGIDEHGSDAAAGDLAVRAPWLTIDRRASDALWCGALRHARGVVPVAPRGDTRDRLQDVIRSAGERISSIQLAELMTRHPQVAAAAVIGMPDDRWGERPIAFIVPVAEAPNLPMILVHLSQFVMQGIISRYALPDRLIVLDALPHTSAGQVDKKALRTLCEFNR
ncbi:MAG: hypothetical protein PGN21_07150 [Sphingomonas paucimobilis]